MDEPVVKVSIPTRTFARPAQPDDATIQEPLPRWMEPLALPVKKMLAVGQNLAVRLDQLADDLDRAMEEQADRSHLLTRIASFSGIALSAGFIAWLLRSGSLLASFLVSMPAWRHFDPLPVLGAGRKERKEHDRKTRLEEEREVKTFRGLDQILKPSGPETKPPTDKQNRTRKPK